MNSDLAFKNCINRPVRSIVLLIMAMTLCFALFFGVLVNFGLKNGMETLNSRLGAEVMIIPDNENAKENFDGLLLQGNPGYFYMDKTVFDKVLDTEGVSKATPQIYLASLAASCCTSKVQLIGFDEETDFVIKPWIDAKKTPKLETMQAFVGSQINAFEGDEIMFYGVNIEVAGRLQPTGTYMDFSVFADDETVESLIATAEENKTFQFNYIEPNEVISAVMINIKEGYDAEKVISDIKANISGVEIITTQNMIEEARAQLGAISKITIFLSVIVWLILLAVMIIAFFMISKERKKEFAILRIIGAPLRKVMDTVLKEILFISSIGGVLGIILAISIAKIASTAIENELGFPFLMPGIGKLIVLSVITLLVTLLTTSLSCAVSAYRVNRTDIALNLKKEN